MRSSWIRIVIRRRIAATCLGAGLMMLATGAWAQDAAPPPAPPQQKPGMFESIGRERCIAAPNGAPDCVSAAEALCRKHGFTSGKSMDFTSAEECPVRTLLGQNEECTTVTFISRAMCQ